VEPTPRIRAWANQLNRLHEELGVLEEQAEHEALRTPLLMETLETLHTSIEELHATIETVLEQQYALDAERERYRDLFDFAPDAYLVTDEKGKIRETNQAASRLFNTATSQIDGWLLLTFVVPDDHRRFIELLTRLRAGERVEEWNLRVTQRGYGSVSTAIVAQPICDEQGAIVGARWQLRDVREQVAQAQTLRESEARLEQRVAERTADLRASEERLRFITENLEEVFWLTSPNEQIVHYISPSYEQVFGRSRESLYADPSSYFAAIHPNDREIVQQQIAQGIDQEHEATYRITRPDGTLRWVWVHTKPIFDAACNVLHRVGIAKDITTRKEYEAQIEALAYSDPLTGLANRRRFFETGAVTFDIARTQGTDLALLYLDLNQFKQVNDTWGHQMGDQLLHTAAARLRLCVRPTDLAARLGGDEFAIVLADTDGAHALSIAQRIDAALSQPYMLDGQTIDIGCSIGIATMASAAQSFSQFVNQADAAMYEAKTTSSTIRVYST
jgi:diguanylate cyclase (GGDEF)-like protein/PAS domain S-box-containing protein